MKILTNKNTGIDNEIVSCSIFLNMFERTSKYYERYLRVLGNKKIMIKDMV